MQPDRSARIMIYALVDPVTRAVGYIGQTVAPTKRYREHLRASGWSRRAKWVRGLIAEGTPPRLVPFDSAETQWSADLLERFWIRHGRRVGWPLTNELNGGELAWQESRKTPQAWSPESRAKIGAANRGRIVTAKQRAAIGDRMRGKKFSDEHRAKMGASQKGHPVSEATRKLIGAAASARRHTAESRAKIVAWNMGRTFSDETRAKMSVGAIKRSSSPEYTAKQRASHLGKRHTPETIAKLSHRVVSQETRDKISVSKRRNRLALSELATA